MGTELDTDEQKHHPCSPIRGMDWDFGTWSREGEGWDWSRTVACGHSGHSDTLQHLLVSQFDMGEHLPLQRIPALLRDHWCTPANC